MRPANVLWGEVITGLTNSRGISGGSLPLSSLRVQVLRDVAI